MCGGAGAAGGGDGSTGAGAGATDGSSEGDDSCTDQPPPVSSSHSLQDYLNMIDLNYACIFF